MGWTSTHREKGTTHEEFLLHEFSEGTRCHASGTVDNVFYAAMETPKRPGEVWAYVALIHWSPGYYNFSWKDMDETVLPFACAAPASVMRALTPTENPNALEWRDRVERHHAQRKALRGLRDGDQVVMNRPLTFTDGLKHDTFTVRRHATSRGKATQVVLTTDEGGYRVSKWRDRVVAIIRDGETIPTPLASGVDEDRYVSMAEHLTWEKENREALVEHYGTADYGIMWAARQEYRRGERHPLVIAALEKADAERAASAA